MPKPAVQMKGINWTKLANRASGLSYADLTRIAQDAIKQSLIDKRPIVYGDLVDAIDATSYSYSFDGQWGSMRFARLMGNLDCRYSGNKVDFCWRGDEEEEGLTADEEDERR